MKLLQKQNKSKDECCRQTDECSQKTLKTQTGRQSASFVVEEKDIEKPNTKSSVFSQTLFSHSRNIALIALLAATLSVGKLALMFLPNIEVVTLLILVYSSVFGKKTAFSTVIFCLIESFLYPFGTWVLLYFLYWVLLSVVASAFLKNLKLYKAIVLAMLATIFFGLFDAVIYAFFAVAGAGSVERFFVVAAIYYARGIWFCVLHVISNTIVVALLYSPLTLALKRIAEKSEFRRLD